MRHLPADLFGSMVWDFSDDEWCDCSESENTFFMIELDGQLAKDLEEELRTGWLKNQIEAKVEVKKFAKANTIRHKSVEGLGQLVARIPTTAYHFWGQKLGYGCWNDKAFMDEFLRDNPELRVNSGGTKEISVGWTPNLSPK